MVIRPRLTFDAMLNLNGRGFDARKAHYQVTTLGKFGHIGSVSKFLQLRLEWCLAKVLKSEISASASPFQRALPRPDPWRTCLYLLCSTHQ